MIELIEVAPNEYKPFGKITVSDNEVKTVIVDGESYSRTIRKTKDIEVSEYPFLSCIELDELECFGFTAKVWDYSYSYSTLFRDALKVGYVLSTNDYVYYWQSLFHSNKLPDWIRNVYTDETRRMGRDLDSIKPHCTVKICDYGFKNSLYADIDWQVVFNCKDTKNEHLTYINRLLKIHGITIHHNNEQRQINNAIKLLLKQQKQ